MCERYRALLLSSCLPAKQTQKVQNRGSLVIVKLNVAPSHPSARRLHMCWGLCGVCMATAAPTAIAKDQMPRKEKRRKKIKGQKFARIVYRLEGRNGRVVNAANFFGALPRIHDGVVDTVAAAPLFYQRLPSLSLCVAPRTTTPRQGGGARSGGEEVIMVMSGRQNCRMHRVDNVYFQC